jgi:FKBP-type peptidyl-prolyl cis-trans isomerase
MSNNRLFLHNNRILWIAAGIFLLFGCVPKGEKNAGEKRMKTPGGLAYIMHHDEPGTPAELGDVLVLQMKYGTGDTVLFDSRMSQRPVYIQYTNPSFRGGLEEGLSLLSAGDTATFFLSADSVFNRMFRQPLPKGIRTGDELRFKLAVQDVRNEDRDLQAYLRNQSISVPPRASGLYVVSLSQGGGTHVRDKATVTLHYVATLVNGTEFDNTRKRNDPLVFKKGSRVLNDGLEEGVGLLRQGDKARLVIPSYLAFAEKGSYAGLVPPFSTVIYDVEVVSVK